jgi:hypothetical protein
MILSPIAVKGRPDKSYRANPPAIAKIAARPAAIAAPALHWLCSYTKRRSQPWIVKTGFQASFCAAGLPQPNPRRHEPEESSGGGKGFRKNFECQFHVRFRSGVALV